MAWRGVLAVAGGVCKQLVRCGIIVALGEDTRLGVAACATVALLRVSALRALMERAMSRDGLLYGVPASHAKRSVGTGGGRKEMAAEGRGAGAATPTGAAVAAVAAAAAGTTRMALAETERSLRVRAPSATEAPNSSAGCVPSPAMAATLEPPGMETATAPPPNPVPAAAGERRKAFKLWRISRTRMSSSCAMGGIAWANQSVANSSSCKSGNCSAGKRFRRRRRSLSRSFWHSW
jgi:hypothetical protein